MPQIEPDFSELVELTPGTYKAHVVDATVKTSQKGAQYIKWKLEVFDCPDSKLNGKPVWTNTMTSGPGAFGLKQLVKAALGASAPNGALNTEDLYGKAVQVVLVDGIDRQTGEPSGFPEVKAIKPLH